MKVIAINGSPKAEGNTYNSLLIMRDEFKNQGIEMEIIHVGHKAIHGCIACGKCGEAKNEQCPSFPNDIVNETIQLLKSADGIILASPVYFAGVAGTLKCFLDRSFYVERMNGGFFKNKIGAAISVQRRMGASATLDCLNHYLTASEMPLASSTYWNGVHGLMPGEIHRDEEGVQTLRNLAKNMGWLLKMREATRDTISTPDSTKAARTNFIR